MSQNKDRWKFGVALHFCSSVLSLKSWQSYRLRAFETETTFALSDQLSKYAVADLKKSITAPFVSLDVPFWKLVINCMLVLITIITDKKKKKIAESFECRRLCCFGQQSLWKRSLQLVRVLCLGRVLMKIALLSELSIKQEEGFYQWHYSVCKRWAGLFCSTGTGRMLNYK